MIIDTHKGCSDTGNYLLGLHWHPASSGVMEGMLASINGVLVYLDDILVTNLSDEEHLATLEKLLKVYWEFLPNETESLYRLLKHSKMWECTAEQQQVFTHSKNLLLTSRVLVHSTQRRQML